MVGDSLTLKFPSTFHFYFSLINKLLQKCSMMNDLVMTTQGRVFILYGVETMRTGGYNFLYIIAIQHVNVGHGLHLDKKLLTSPSSRISSAGFFLSSHRIAHPYLLQNLHDSSGDFLVPLIK